MENIIFCDSSNSWLQDQHLWLRKVDKAPTFLSLLTAQVHIASDCEYIVQLNGLLGNTYLYEMWECLLALSSELTDDLT